MNTVPVLLAGIDPEDPLAWWRLSNPALLEGILIFGAVAVVTLLLLIWAAFVRSKRRRRHSHHHHRHHHSPSVTEVQPTSQNEESPALPEKRRRRRHSHHHHRPRNPTLAETGGLPPIRSEEPPEAEH